MCPAVVTESSHITLNPFFKTFYTTHIMRKVTCMLALVAVLAVTSVQARSLQQNRPAFDISKLDLSKLPNLPALGLLPQGVELPPLQDFLPPLDSINLPPLNEFLQSVGLPTWEEMNLPPLSEFMKPVFDPQEVKMPSLADVVKQANETFVATLQDILKGVPLPPGVKMPELKLPPLPNVDLSKVTIPNFDLSKLPPPPSVEQLIAALNALQNGDIIVQQLIAALNALQNGDIIALAKMVNVSVPTNLPPLSEVMAQLKPLAEAVQKLPQAIDLSQLSKVDLSKIDISKIDFTKLADLSKIDLQGLLSGKVDLKSLAAIGEVLKALPPPPQGMQMPRLDQVLPAVNKVVSLFNNNRNNQPALRSLLQVQ
ncbi:hypothetical protein OEZ85_013560 [Tetradesmus obliquus]|uniref:Uncharacterized protein n=1 Tax=Tetradesmus obliquus TaxID=3088 RepID=A0ABY8UU61_TETOB|nr:hypothetical protein OEZ85_013560 [Tetradesmus obliquus]WIA23916.1 hypothetical protein OEZ85_013560 [Tetradesmus obliquus]